jgi:PAS domain S-box-containing protein
MLGRPVPRSDWFFALVILGVCLAVLWSGKTRYDEWRDYQRELGKRAAAGTAHEVRTYIEEIHHRVGLLASIEADTLRRLASNPKQEALKKKLEEVTSRHFPDYFAISLAAPSGESLFDDFDGLVGDVCQRDIQGFGQGRHDYTPFIHPHAEVYHFDTMVRWEAGGDQGIFFISFRPTTLARLLRDGQPHGYELMLLRRDVPGLIEVTADGPRVAIKRNFRLTAAELAQASALVPVTGTQWDLVALPDPAQAAQARERIEMETLLTLGGVLGISGVGAFFLRRERRRRDAAEQSLLSERNFVGAVLDAADALVLAVGDDGKIVRVNRAFSELTGLAPERVVRVTLASLPAFDEAGREKLLQPPITSTAPADARMEIPVFGRGGQMHEVAWSVTALCDVQGHKEFLIWTGTDITHHKRIDRLKSEFISTVSHELRTPLTSIRGALGLLGGGAAGLLSPQAQSMVDVATRNSERLLTLINDLLDIEKIESGNMKLNLAVLSPAELVHQTVDSLRSYAQQFQVEMIEQDEAGGACIEGDAARLTQVLANLLSNAIKFSPAGASVDVRIIRHDGWLRLSVNDRGPGIPEAFHDRIFSKFSQADASDSRAKGGTGLGLAISKAIVELHGGRIGFDSRPGGGSIFYFDLPVVACTPA